MGTLFSLVLSHSRHFRFPRTALLVTAGICGDRWILAVVNGILQMACVYLYIWNISMCYTRFPSLAIRTYHDGLLSWEGSAIDPPRVKLLAAHGQEHGSLGRRRQAVPMAPT